MEMVFEILAQTEVVVESSGAGLDPKLAMCSVIIAYLLQALRRIKWVDGHKGAMPFIALGLGVLFAFLKLRDVMPWEDIAISGCILGLTASGFQSLAKKLPMGMNAVKNVGNGAAVILLCLCLVGVGGCGGVNLSPQYENQLAAQVAWAGDMVSRANVEPTGEGCAVGEFTLTQVREVFEINRDQWLLFWEASQGVAPGE